VHLAATFDEDGHEVTPARSIGYDTLIIAISSVTNDFGTRGVAEYAVPLETSAQADRFNRRLLNACLRAQTGTPRTALSILVRSLAHRISPKKEATLTHFDPRLRPARGRERDLKACHPPQPFHVEIRASSMRR